MKDYARKNYTDHQYRDWMKTVTSKSVFNQVLEQTTGLGEFSNNKSNKTSLSRAIAAFLKQSAFKKPGDKGFKDMEEDWEGPPGFRLDNRFDQPWNMQQPWIRAAEPVVTIFDAELEGGWCDGSAESITITGTHPIYEVVITYGTGASLSNITGYGTNSVTCDIEVAAEYSGFVTIEAIMTSSEGISGDSNVNVYESDQCCFYETPYVIYGNKGTHLSSLRDSWAAAGNSPCNSTFEFSPFVDLTSGKLDTPDPFYDAGRGRWMFYISVGGLTGDVTTVKYKILLYNSVGNRYNLVLEEWEEAEVMDLCMVIFTDGFNPTVNDFNAYTTRCTDYITPPRITFNQGDDPAWIEFTFNQAGIDYINANDGWIKFMVMSKADFDNAEPEGSYAGRIEGYDYEEILALRHKMIVEC